MDETPAAALEREHREIDAGIEAFTESLTRGEFGPEPLRRAMDTLRRHIYLEEEFLFPPLRTAGLVGPVLVMLREHGELWQSMGALEALLAEGADAGTATVRDRCRELLAQLDRHNSKEEPIVYPQAERVLTESATAELRTLIASGELPEGWVCRAAEAG